MMIPLGKWRMCKVESYVQRKAMHSVKTDGVFSLFRSGDLVLG